jgi:4-amino-4-deoxy-L-arabinose transferase-like glycosyltransferase
MTSPGSGSGSSASSSTPALAAVALAWLVAALAVPLFPDETYYWVWSRHLAAGYFDHPPAIAWLLRAGTALFGATPLGVRAPMLACGVLTALAVGRIAARLGGPSAAGRAILLFAVMPLVTGTFVLATPDAPLLTAVAWSLYAVLRAVELKGAAATRWWLAAGALLGAAGLSKYTAVLVPVGLVVVALLYRPLRRLFATPGPYLAAALAGAMVLPVVAWNAGHDWISFRFQLEHGLDTSRGVGFLDREFQLIGLQFATATPILFGFLVAAVWRVLRRRDDQRAVLLAGVAAFIAAFFVWTALRSHVEANWPAVAYPAAAALLGAWAVEGRARRWLVGGAILSAALTVALLVHLATPLLPLPREPLATSQAYGREAVGKAVERAAEEAGPAPATLRFVTNRYQDASDITFFLPSHPQAFALNWRSRPNQYDLWPQFPDVARPGDRVLLLINDGPEDEKNVLHVLEPHFASVEKGELVERRVPAPGGGVQVVNRKRIWLLSGWRGTWPTGGRPVP